MIHLELGGLPAWDPVWGMAALPVQDITPVAKWRAASMRAGARFPWGGGPSSFYGRLPPGSCPSPFGGHFVVAPMIAGRFVAVGPFTRLKSLVALRRVRNHVALLFST